MKPYWNAVAAIATCVQAVEQWPFLQDTCQTTVCNTLRELIHVPCKGARLINTMKCIRLKAEHPSQVSLPIDDSYQIQLSNFWSMQQSQSLPACIFSPRTAQDVAFIINVSRDTLCPFAVKSGGHVPFAGASNIPGGITVDFAALDGVTINKERNTVSVGAGNRWSNVYRKLEDEGVTVVGGRIADVGVGGLTLGGGISFFSNMHGWACDNIASYEVVTAGGEIIRASATSYSDLYWALRGGAGNFGLVTEFELQSYPNENSLMWVGKLLHPISASSPLIKAFVDFGQQDSDDKATALFSFVYLQKQDQYVISSETDYAVAVPTYQHPKVFDAFFDVPDTIHVMKATKTVSEAIDEHSASNPRGLRQSYWTATFRLDHNLTSQVTQIWMEEIESIKQRITGFVPVITFQVITARMLKHMKKSGGNALGLELSDGPLMIVATSAMWTDSAHDRDIMSAYANWVSRSQTRAKEMGLDHVYLYMNYASQFQDPIAGYGLENRRKLQRIATTYDPYGVFEKLQPGYFKL